MTKTIEALEARVAELEQQLAKTQPPPIMCGWLLRHGSAAWQLACQHRDRGLLETILGQMACAGWPDAQKLILPQGEQPPAVKVPEPVKPPESIPELHSEAILCLWIRKPNQRWANIRNDTRRDVLEAIRDREVNNGIYERGGSVEAKILRPGQDPEDVRKLDSQVYMEGTSAPAKMSDALPVPKDPKVDWGPIIERHQRELTDLENELKMKVFHKAMTVEQASATLQPPRDHLKALKAAYLKKPEPTWPTMVKPEAVEKPAEVQFGQQPAELATEMK